MLNPSDITTSGLCDDNILELPALLAGVSSSAYSASVKAAELQGKAMKAQKLAAVQVTVLAGLFLFK